MPPGARGSVSQHALWPSERSEEGHIYLLRFVASYRAIGWTIGSTGVDDEYRSSVSMPGVVSITATKIYTFINYAM